MILILTQTGFSTTINVPGDYNTIQAALNAASYGDRVQVAAGTYVENIHWPAVDGIKLLGAGQEVSIIDGNNTASVIRFTAANVITNATVVRDFTITNGNALPPWPESEGGGIHLYYASPTLEYLTIRDNTADDFGGGIYMWGSSSSPLIRYTIIANNTAISHGGVDCASGSPTFDHCTITGNSPGGMYFETFGTVENSIVSNNLYFNLRVEGNSFSPTTMEVGYSDIPGGWQLIGYATVNDLGGNIDANPMFVDAGNGNYNLQPDSPCIDAGDPTYPFDPDLTITDMGALYFHQYNIPQIQLSTNQLDYGEVPLTTTVDQELTIRNVGDGTLTIAGILISNPDVFFTDYDPSDSLVAAGDSLMLTVTFAPQAIVDYSEYLRIENDDEPVQVDLTGSGVNQVVVSLTPYGTPITIPSGGGSFDFNIEVSNLTPDPQTFDIWTVVELPGSGSVTLINVPNINLSAFTVVDRERTQFVPATAPSGMYTYNAYIGDYPLVINNVDSFQFEKAGNNPGTMGSPDDWFQTGEAFESGQVSGLAALPEKTILKGAYPNPFNPTTTLRYELSAASSVSLTVFDIQGREVATLVDGFRDAGSHEVTFDASNLASGVYLYRLEANNFSAIGKMMLVK